MKLPLTWAAEALKARCIGNSVGEFTGVCTDTRQGTANRLFFALSGEHADGHQYVGAAFAAGAAGAVVSREIAGAPGPLLVVPDTLRALGDLAAAYRKRFPIPVVGVTGSVGKTSTKEMIAAVLRNRYSVLVSAKNFNNEIGVPQTLFELTPQHEVAVLEMGMRGLGEIDRLAEIAQPAIGLITCIGFAHIERLGSQQKIAEAKSELLARLPSDGTAIYPLRPRSSVSDATYENPPPTEAATAWALPDETLFAYLRSRVPAGCRTILFGQAREGFASPDVQVSFQRVLPDGGMQAQVLVHREAAQMTLRAPGVHLLHNAAAALSVGLALDVPLPAAIGALEAWQGAEGRMAVRKTSDGLTVLDDCYNAGPESMAAALSTLSLLCRQESGAGRAAILGDMKELGEFAPEAHRIVGRKAASIRLNLLMTVGELAAEIGEEMKRTLARQGARPPVYRHFPDSESCAAEVSRWMPGVDAVLVKGSRAMQMEQIVAALTGETGADSHD